MIPHLNKGFEMKWRPNRLFSSRDIRGSCFESVERGLLVKEPSFSASGCWNVSQVPYGTTDM